VNSETDARYRLRLARGFKKEAEQDLQLQRWRFCVDNAQLSAENAGKAIIALFEPVDRTHNPATTLRKLINNNVIDASLIDDLNSVLSDFDELGFDPKRLVAAGFGQYRPIAAGDSPEARAQNRRIELKLTER